MRRISLFFIGLFFLFGSCTSQQYNEIYRTTIDAGEYEMVNHPIFVDLEADDAGDLTELCVSSAGQLKPAQADVRSGSVVRVWWLADQAAGESVDYSIVEGADCGNDEYEWESVDEHSLRLSYGGQPVLQYEHPVFDPEDIDGSRKPFHHVFDPAGGDLITKGPGGLYSHHRGIFFGYNHVYVGDSEQELDIWHANDGERSEHEEIVREITGPVTGGHEVTILWKDFDGEPFIEEQREVRVFRQSENSILIDFHSVLNAVDEPVRLEGDLQHAGVQYRAAQYVGEHADETRFIRPEGWEHLPPDEELDEENRTDLPWDAMHYNIEGDEYTVAYLSHPSNPGGAEMSERRYGRFGEFFPYVVTRENPLEVNYRFWVVSGEPPSAEEIERIYQLYIHQ